MKKIFLGTPYIAARVFDSLINSGIVFDAVITACDKPFGRKKIITPPPLKVEAIKYGVRVFQAATNAELEKIIEDLKPDYGFVVAYGMIIKKSTLEMVKNGLFNLHFSLLPAYRGADPVRWALINGELKTGVSVFKIDEGLDTGPILLSQQTPIYDNEKYDELLIRLSDMGSKLLLETVDIIEKGNIVLKPQQGIASYAPKVSVKESYIDFSSDSSSVYNRIRAFSSDPYARFTFTSGEKKTVIQIIEASRSEYDPQNYSAGQLCGFKKGKGIFVKCMKGSIIIYAVKPEGKNIMNAFDYFINGMGLKEGERIV
ncbi:MAG: methionyl-tRNA formyltransferase [Elusimicrobiales bacterium]